MELSGACLERDRGDDPLVGPWYVRLIRRVTPVMENRNHTNDSNTP